MNFEIERDDATQVIRFRGEVSMREIAALSLDPLDRAQLNAPAETPADHLLDLEMIFRRHAEQAEDTP